MNNIFSNQEGWYYTKNMETYFAGDTVYTAWIDGKKSDSLSVYGMYTLSSVVCFAKGAVTDTAFETQTVMTSDHYDECEIRMIKSGKGLTLVIKENDTMWIQKIDEHGRFIDIITKADEQDKSLYLSTFSQTYEFPCSIILSPE
jgi:hypothetical protein